MNRSPGDEVYTEAEWHQLTHDVRPTGSELRRVRLELRELCLEYCPEVADGVVIPSGQPSVQLELFR